MSRKESIRTQILKRVSGLKRLSRTILYPSHLRRTGTTAFIVGSWLTVINQGDAIWSGELHGWLPFKVALNYLTPFVVANLGLLSKKS